jgi:hypothetical protein
MRLSVITTKVSWLPFLTVLSLAAGAHAQTACVAPEVPPSPFNGSTAAKAPTPPVKPNCSMEPAGLWAQKMGDNICPTGVIDEYNLQVSAYNGALDSYATSRRDYMLKLQDYVNKAAEYGQCELDAARNSPSLPKPSNRRFQAFAQLEYQTE